MFVGAYEKQLDAKRRIVVPQEFRALVAAEGVVAFPSFEADCLEAGGQALFAQYKGLMDELAFGDPLRSALETTVYSGMSRLPFDTAGRVVLPEDVCAQFALTDWVVLAGLGDRFQIWDRDAFHTHRSAQRLTAREGLARLRADQRGPRPGVAA